jgi:ABC-2 type transport system ATP-binding protein
LNGVPLLHATGVVRSFGDRPVLNGLELEVGRGQVCGLLGTNGAGKTTALNIITGLLPADSGSVVLAGVRNTCAPRSLIGFAPQEAALYSQLSCAENLAFFGRVYGWRGRRLSGRVNDVIELTRLAEYRDARVSTLSGGTRRRLNLAVAMVHDPELLILDEPTAGLDIEARFAVWEVIRRFRNSGASVLLTTHLLDEAAKLCDRISLLHEGVIAREGTLDELCASVPAAQVGEIESDDEAALLLRTAELGLAVRRQGGRFSLLLPEPTSLESLLQLLSGAAIRSIALRPVGLEDVFVDVVTSSPALPALHTPYIPQPHELSDRPVP